MVDVLKPGGTGAAIGNGLTYTMAGKTGTAQVVSIKQGASTMRQQLPRTESRSCLVHRLRSGGQAQNRRRHHCGKCRLGCGGSRADCPPTV